MYSSRVEERLEKRGQSPPHTQGIPVYQVYKVFKASYAANKERACNNSEQQHKIVGVKLGDVGMIKPPPA